MKKYPTPDGIQEPSAYGFMCNNDACLALMVIYPHPESPGLLDPFVQSVPIGDPMWDDSSPGCPNCGESMSLETGDPVSHIVVGTKGLYR